MLSILEYVVSLLFISCGLNKQLDDLVRLSLIVAFSGTVPEMRPTNQSINVMRAFQKGFLFQYRARTTPDNQPSITDKLLKRIKSQPFSFLSPNIILQAHQIFSDRLFKIRDLHQYIPIVFMIKNCEHSTTIKNLIFGVLLIVIANSFDFAARNLIDNADQFSLWQGNIIPIGQYESAGTMVVLPASYDSSYYRTLALAGYSFNMGSIIDYQLWLQPFFADSVATVGLRTGASITVYQISAYIFFVNVSSNWVRVFNSSHSFITINDPSAGAGSENFSLTGPSISSPWTSQAYAFIISFNSFTDTNGPLGGTIGVTSLTAPNSYDMIAIKASAVGLVRIQFSVLIIDDVQLLNNNIMQHTDIKSFSSNSLLSPPTNLAIPTLYGNSSFGGYDGSCLIGLYYLLLGGQSPALHDRSLTFDAHSNPFASVQNVIYSGDFFNSYHRIICLMECPTGTAYSGGACITCMSNCDVCSNTTECQECSAGYRPNVGNTSCLTCLNMTITCLDCLNSTYCTVCINDTYGISGNHLCEPCSTMISNCTSCTNYTYCSQCANTGYYLAAGNQICLLCSVTLPNCLNCSSAGNCSVCINSSYYIGTDALCHPCSDSLPGCLECILINPSITNCTRCADYYFITSTSRCSTCAMIPNCLNCTNGSYCLSCVNSFLAFSAVNNSCLPCADLFENCLQCTNQQCTSCQAGLVSLDGGLSCQCVLGNFINGLCNTIIGCILPVLLPDGSLGCLACDPANFEPSPINGVCQCLSGSLISGVCSDNPGCLTTLTAADGSQVCAFCNVTAGFLGAPDSGGNCVCPSHFQMQDSSCADSCGDGFLESSSQNACDDGNKESDDGCSSNCLVEVGFRCENGSSSTASACVYVGIPLVLSLKRIERSDGLNQGVFQFSVSPPLITINRMNLSRYVSFVCDSTYTISDISYSAGTLKLVADYSTDMEGLPCELTLSFDSGVIRSPSASLSFLAVSRNALLTISHHLSEYGTIKLIFGYLALIVLGLFVLSLPHKMIGAELLFNCQLVYLSNAFYARASFLFGSVKDFGLVSGYWSFFYDEAEHADLLQPFTERVELTPSFLEDSMIVVGVLLVLVLLFIVSLVWRALTQQNQEEQGDHRQSESSLTVVARTVYNCFLFPVAAGFSCVLTIAVYVNNLGLLGASPQRFSYLLNSTSLLFVWLTLGVIAGIELLSFRSGPEKAVLRLRGLEGVRPWYIPTFILREATVILLVKTGTAVTYDCIAFVLLAISLLYLVLMVRTRPYRQSIHNVGLIACELTSTYAIMLSVLPKFALISESVELFLLLVLEGSIIVATFMALLRIILVYRDLTANCLLEKRTTSRQQQIKQCKRDFIEQEQNLKAQQMQQINPYRIGQNHSIIKNFNVEILRPSNIGIHKTHIKIYQDEFYEVITIKNRLRDNLFDRKMKKQTMHG